MNQEVPNSTNTNEEVDLIRLMDYFKNGIKSIFKKLWKLIEVFLHFVVLLKKNWPIVIGLIVAGAAYGLYVKYLVTNETESYEMIVSSNPISNIELYAFSSEIVNRDLFTHKNEGIDLVKKLGIKSLKIEPIERESDVVNSYFDQIEGAIFRSDQTDTLYYQTSEIGDFKSKMNDEDYPIQRLKIKVKGDVPPAQIQENLLNYFNNLPGPKREQENKLTVLKSYENNLKRNIDNIDSILISRAALNHNSGLSGTEQLLVNTASRGNVEADLLRYAESFSRKLYGTQKKISEYQKGMNVVSNLRMIDDTEIYENPVIKYTVTGFLLAVAIVLLMHFNNYLSKFQKEKY